MRKGFTLIELLIVVTIIAILAGAAIPFVQDYVDQAKVARARVDMNEIRNALARWEVDRGVWPPSETTIAKLVGPYLSKNLVDPWGAPYVVNEASSTIYTKGTDGAVGGGDDLLQSFRPRMAISRMEYTDVNGNGKMDTGDTITFTCTRPPTTYGSNLSGITIGGVALNGVLNTSSYSVVGRKYIVPLTGNDQVSLGGAIAITNTGAAANQNTLADNSLDHTSCWAGAVAAGDGMRLLSTN